MNKYLLKTKIITTENITTTMDSATIKKYILNALDLIKSLNKELHGLINQLVGTIIFSKTGNFSSATSQTHLGIIFLNPSDSWDIIDYAEAIYHEFIHLSIFLEDMVQSLFNQKLVEADNPQIISVLRGVNRPLVKSFHAAAVSIGIMHFYYMLGKDEKSTKYIAELQEALDIFNKMEKYFDIKRKELLYNMNLFLKTKDFKSITHSLES